MTKKQMQAEIDRLSGDVEWLKAQLSAALAQRTVTWSYPYPEGQYNMSFGAPSVSCSRGFHLPPD